MTDVSDDDISLTSTTPSPLKENYFVDTIHAERETPQGIEYLVGWEDYPVERSTWETAAQFDDEETLFDWEEKKREVAAGRLPAFDLAEFNRRLHKAEEAHRDRVRRRHAKKQSLARKWPRQSSADFHIGPKEIGRVDPGVRARSLVDASAISTGRPTSSKSQAVPTHPQSIRDGPARPPPVGFGTRPGALIRARPRMPLDTDPSVPLKKFKNLSQKNRYEKARGYEPAPDISQLELIRPSEWPSTPGATLAKSAPQHVTPIDGEKPNGGATQKGGGDPDIGTHAFQPLRSSSMDSHSPVQTSPDARRSHIKLDLPRQDLDLPRRRPGPRALFMKNGLFVNNGELLVTLYYGPDKTEIGESRLCGLNFDRRNSFMKTKKFHRIEVWFQHLCNLTDYHTLAQNTPIEKPSNGWIEGFDNTEPNIFKFGEELRSKNLVAISLYEGRDVLLAYPPESLDFRFLNGSSKGPPDVFLYTVSRNMLGPIERLIFGNQKGQRGHRIETNTEAVNASGSNAFCANDKHSAWSRPKEDNCHSTIQGSNTSTGQEPRSDTSTVTKPTKESNSRDSMLISQKFSIEGVPMDIDQTAGNSTTATTGDKMQPRTVAEHPPDLDVIFQNRFGVTFEELATIAEKGRLAGSFCVLFPPGSGGIQNECQQECQLLVEFLKSHSNDRYKAIIYSNRTPEDWEKFTQARNGVTLIHESFLDYYKLRNLNILCRQSTFSFWSFSLSRQAGDVQPPFQRMFSNGGVTLITEDFMLHDPRGTVIILAWFAEYAKSKYPGTRKLMFRPEILNWLLKQIDTAENTYLWLAMYQFILQITSLGGATSGKILTGAEYGYTPNSVISPTKLPLYGSRTEKDNPEIPKGLTQTQRNADHLVEFFAGWALINCHQFRKFYVLTSVGPLRRWDEWQHLEIKVGSPAIMKFLDINYAVYWEKLKNPLKSKSPAETKPQTPFTPQTPKTASTRESAVTKASSPYAPPLKHSYPQPYQ
ncbi:hypothetical protein BBP40_005216 [Aspergillus hancockii]|nr:hypothetical protein BBP40_005216 [Aspergillus hancockii]